MKKHSSLLWMILVTALLPAAYLLVVWDTLPPTVTTHYGADLKPDRISSKSELWITTGILAVVSIVIYFLLTNLHRFDPKRKGTQPSAAFNKLAFGLVIFLAVLSVTIIVSAQGILPIQSLLFPLLGLLFAFIGNYMNSIKPNYFAGIRLPWTLSSDDNWRRTHQMAGKLWFAGGILTIIAGLVLPASSMWIVLTGLLLVMVVVPVLYSYRLFKQQV